MRCSRLAEALNDRVAVHRADGCGRASLPDPDLAGVCFDSRRVQPGELFCALPGAREDGLRHALAALDRGAAAVLHAGAPLAIEAPQLLANDPDRLAESAGLAAALVCGEPSRALWTAAVTGTNGKTTVLHLLAQALESVSIPAARIGTLGLAFRDLQYPGRLTTPPADELQAFLRQAVAAGARAAVVEASSHGLCQERLAGFQVDVAAWTNLSHDHLDYHRDLEEYAAAKARLITGLPAEGVAFLPWDDARVRAACTGGRARLVGWSLSDPAAALRGQVRTSADGLALEISGELGRARIESRLVGRHNAENLLVAFGLARCAGLAPEEAAAGLAAALGPPGRLERVASDAPWRLFVDYAHTPEALRNALSALRAAWPGARLGVVFGAGGDRDPSKRAPMGQAAAEGSDWCLVTSDNPRTEDPEAIVAAVAAGVAATGRDPEVEVDRRAAIRRAVTALAPGEVLLVAGKGHETYQEIHGVRHDFDDRIELEEAARCSA